MLSDLPVVVDVSHGDVDITGVPFAQRADAEWFIHSQARAADALGHNTFSATVSYNTGRQHAKIGAVGLNITGQVVQELAGEGGYTTLQVPGIDAIVFAHVDDDGGLRVGLIADDGQRVRVTINELDLTDFTVGERAGHYCITSTNAHPSHASLSATFLQQPSVAESLRIAEAAATFNPIGIKVTLS